MVTLRNVGVREFRDHATTYLSGNEPIAVNKHGQVIGFYIPLEGEPDQVRGALEKLGATVDKVLADSRLSEASSARLLDLRHQRAE